ncbi:MULTISPECIES: hypothetical protein [Halomonadaceae]|nr:MULTISPECIES: hypothetical protein [Halomonas]MCD6007978.1 hypothetical protein [Halomonas sp. IOP_31]MEA3250270.1 hypothetical protein [Pseudomonadota bacterium]
MMTQDATAPALPWWLQAGDEECPFCLRRYHVEAGYYCMHCDQPICPFCVVELRESRETVCPDCREEV